MRKARENNEEKVREKKEGVIETEEEKVIETKEEKVRETKEEGVSETKELNVRETKEEVMVVVSWQDQLSSCDENLLEGDATDAAAIRRTTISSATYAVFDFQLFP